MALNYPSGHCFRHRRRGVLCTYSHVALRLVCYAARPCRRHNIRRVWYRRVCPAYNHGLSSRCRWIWLDNQVRLITVSHLPDWLMSIFRIFGLVLGVCGGIALLGVNPRFPVRKPTDERPRRQWFPRNLSPYKNPVFLSMVRLFESFLNTIYRS